MKKLITTALSLLLMSLASVSYGQNVETISGVGYSNRPNGDVYVGELSNGKFHGRGVYTYINGESYMGYFVDGLREGIGLYENARGSQYVGEFKNGKRNGQGTYMYNDGSGRTQTGIWENGRLITPNTIETSAEMFLSWKEELYSLSEATETKKLLEQEANLLAQQQENERAITGELSGDLDTKVLNVQDYLTRVLPLVNQGDEKAIEWLTKAAEQGSVEAQYHLGYNLVRGQGIAQDEAQAEYWLTKSAEAGNIDSRQELQRSLGWTIDQVNILTVMKPRCSSFGFEEGTDGHATCVMELQIAEEALAQARELAEETQNEINQRFNEIEDARERAVAIGAAQQQAARRYEAEQRRVAEEQSRQRALGRALMSIGAGVSSGRGIGAGSSSNSGGMFKTCNYNVLGEIVPFPVRSSQICPVTRDFGGVPGILRYD